MGNRWRWLVPVVEGAGEVVGEQRGDGVKLIVVTEGPEGGRSILSTVSSTRG
jgi:hypothetical protein